MKKGRISKDEELFIKENLHLDSETLGQQLDRDPASVTEFIKLKVARGRISPPGMA